MMKKGMIWVLLLVLLVLPCAGAGATEEKGGYTLKPLQEFGGCVALESGFLLTAPDGTTADDLELRLSIDGESAPSISQKNSANFLIQPAAPLESNRLYTFRLKQAGGEDLTWVYQTMFTFAVTNAFPGDESKGVPLNSGIEITFNYEDYEDIEPYFTIEPHVKGTFERHKKTAVFVPEKLEEQTVYTVTVGGGLKLKDSAMTLGADYRFQFETLSSTAPPATPSTERRPTAYFSNVQMELTPQEVPTLPIYIYAGENRSSSLDTVVYQVPSAEGYIALVKQLRSSCSWSLYNSGNDALDYASLTKVTEFQQSCQLDPNTHSATVPLSFPSKLPEGFYLVRAQINGKSDVMLLQINNTACYYQPSDNGSLLWLNDNRTEKPLADVTVLDTKTGKSYVSGVDGIAMMDDPGTSSGEYDQDHYFILTTKDGKTSVLYGEMEQRAGASYWSYLELDRPLYQPKDTVLFWGYAQERKNAPVPETVTVTLSAARYYWYSSSQPILRQQVQVRDNVFAGELDLPYLEPGSYTLSVKAGETIICNQYVRVQEYVKPNYKMTVSADQKAIFDGGTLTYNMQTSFFDGTPVSGLDLSYNIYSYPGEENITQTVQADHQGSSQVSFTMPETKETGTGFVSFGARATLPEGGEITCSQDTRVFLNTAELDAACPYDTDKTQIELSAHEIDLTRLNNGTAEGYYDYLGAPQAGKTVKGTIYYKYYEKIKTGTRYDYYNKKTYDTYDYEQRTKTVKTFSIKTDADGKAVYPYSLPDKDTGYYTAELTMQDSRGKLVKDEVYLRTKGRSAWIYQPRSYDLYDLERRNAEEDTPCAIGVPAEFELTNNQKSISAGRFLFLNAQEGITGYSVQTSPSYSHVFEEKDIPAVYLRGVYFDGVTYHETYVTRLSFDYSTRTLALQLTQDKESYAPGDSCTLSVHAAKPDGTPAPAKVNISLVDEALFALRDQTVNVLDDLYSLNSSSGLSYRTVATHSYAAPEKNGAPVPMPTASPGGGGGGGGGNSTGGSRPQEDHESARADFRDTALFQQIQLDENGNGTYTFTLPDNITTWRITASALTADRYAATLTQPLAVTLPFFINCTLGDTFLTGDKPQVGLSAYGDSLKEKEPVSFEVWSKSNPGRRVSGNAAAFERVNLPLWTLETGDDTLVVKATTARGGSDLLEHPIQVVPTYHESEKMVRSALTPGMTFEHGEKGLTRLVFTDRSRGALLREIYSLLYQRGDRLESRLSSQTAYNLILQYGDDCMQRSAKNYMQRQPTFNASDYQTTDGGLGLFPYSGSFLSFTAKLLPLLKKEVDSTSMINYLYNQSGLKTDHTPVNAMALYGLAVYQEPILLELNQLASVENLAPLDAVYCALAYVQLSETGKAQALYDRCILPLTEDLSPYARVNTGGDQADIIELTAMAAVLASQLGAPQREGFFRYACDNFSEDYEVNIEKLLYVTSEISRFSGTSCTIRYSLFGEEQTKTLKNGACFSLELASQNMDALQINGIDGEADVLSSFTVPMANEFPQSDDITVSRTFYKYGSDQPATVFHQNDIIQVVITVQYGDTAVNGSYEVTDLLPSGLKFLENTDSMPQEQSDSTRICYGRIAGQKVQFYSSTWQYTDVYTYLARVQCPGTYQAEAPLVQSTSADGIMKLGQVQEITILPE